MSDYQKSLTELTTMVRGYLDEASTSFWTAAQITSYINQAKDRVATECRRLKRDFFLVTRSSTDGTLTILGQSYAASGFAIAVGGTTMTLPHDFLEMRLIECLTSNYEQVRFVHRDLADADMRAAMEVTANVTPGMFYFDLIAERTLRYAPKSDTALDLRINYLQQFPDLSGSDALTMPYPLYLAVVSYATASALMQDRDPNAAAFEARGKQIIGEVFYATMRQSQDLEIIPGYMEDW